MSQLTINHLPPEMLCAVFEHFGPADLFEKKRVCKLWNRLIATRKIKRLSVDADLVLQERWYHSNRPCSEGELCHPDLFVCHYKTAAFSKLEYLKLNSRLWNKKLNGFDLNQLNMLRQLVHLELFYHQNKKLRLSLPNLQVLLLDWPSSYCRIEIDCPKLRIFRNRENVECGLLPVHHPTTIQVLETATICRKFAAFTNLESLKYSHNDIRFYNKSILLNFQKLKALHFDFSPELLVLSYEDTTDNDFNETMQALKEFMQQKRSLGRSNLAVYLCGLRLIKDDLSDIQFEFEVRNEMRYLSIERFYIRYYERLQAKMAFIFDVNYSELIESVPRESGLPGDYFSRFCNLSRVTATCPLDESHFLEFLKNLFRLNSLELYDCDLSQFFFNSLPGFGLLDRFCLFLSDRPDQEEREVHELELNFHFLSHFDKLIFVLIDQIDLSLSSLRTFIAAFRNMRRVFCNEWTFKFEGVRFMLKRNGKCFDETVLSQSYKLIADDREILLENVSLDEVIQYFERQFRRHIDS